MKIVSVKFQEDILKQMDKIIIKHNFNSRTEFIREAVRDKLNQLTKEELIAEFMKFRGKSKIKTTPEENLKTKKAVSAKLMKYLDKKFK